MNASLSIILLLFLIINCICVSSVPLNLTEICSGSKIVHCSLRNIEAKQDDVLFLTNASVPHLQELVLFDSILWYVHTDIFTLAPNLRNLALYKCDLYRFLNNNFGGAHNLEILLIQKNRILEVLGKRFYGANSLKELHLGDNKIHFIHPYAFKGLKELIYLDLQSNYIRFMHDELFYDLEKLEYIDLSKNNIQHIYSVTFANNLLLRTIILRENELTMLDPNTFNHLPYIHLLDLTNNLTPNIILNSIGELLIGGNHLRNLTITGSAIKINANDNNLNSISIGDKLSVRELFLNKNEFKTLNDLNGMLNLEELDISENEIEALNSDASNLHLILPNLSTLNLSSNRLNNITIYSFLLLEKLTKLDLSFNLLEQMDNETFLTLRNLEYLDLEENLLSSFDYEDFVKNHPKLREISLSKNPWELNFENKILEFFKNHSAKLIIRQLDGYAINTQTRTDVDTIDSSTYQKQEQKSMKECVGVSGIHPYWTTRDILTVTLLCFVALILLLQLYRILRDERCINYIRERIRRYILCNNEENQHLNEFNEPLNL